MLGQISLSSAVALALQNSPRIKMAQDDIIRATAVQTENKDAYVPRVVATGGVGSSYGITLGVPTIFTIGTQSLIFSYSQRNYLHAAGLGTQSAMLSLNDARDAVAEDVAITYMALDHGEQTKAALVEEYASVQRLGVIVEERHLAGLESDLESRVTRRLEVQVRLQQLEVEDEMTALREHLGGLMGLPADQLATVPGSVPEISSDQSAVPSQGLSDSLALQATAADAQAKQARALGDSRFRWRPLVTLQGQYGRVSPINGVTDYYNIHGNYNAAFAGLQIELPFLDAGRKARAQQTAADASKATHELALLQSRQREDRVRMTHSLTELKARTELAELDVDIARDHLKATLVQMSKGGLGGAPVTPKEEQNARIHERDQYITLLKARFEVKKFQIYRLRQTGELLMWVQGLTLRDHGASAP